MIKCQVATAHIKNFFIKLCAVSTLQRLQAHKAFVQLMFASGRVIAPTPEVINHTPYIYCLQVLPQLIKGRSVRANGPELQETRRLLNIQRLLALLPTDSHDLTMSNSQHDIFREPGEFLP
jgi:hypothetical protein